MKIKANPELESFASDSEQEKSKLDTKEDATPVNNNLKLHTNISHEDLGAN